VWLYDAPWPIFSFLATSPRHVRAVRLSYRIGARVGSVLQACGSGPSRWAKLRVVSPLIGLGLPVPASLAFPRRRPSAFHAAFSPVCGAGLASGSGRGLPNCAFARRLLVPVLLAGRPARFPGIYGSRSETSAGHAKHLVGLNRGAHRSSRCWVEGNDDSAGDRTFVGSWRSDPVTIRLVSRTLGLRHSAYAPQKRSEESLGQAARAQTGLRRHRLLNASSMTREVRAG